MRYVCSHCNCNVPAYRLSCPDCGSWNSLSRGSTAGAQALPVALPDIASVRVPRRSTNVAALDRLLGGGIVQGSSLLLIGPPGAGKSTLVLQMLRSMGVAALYATGEESVQLLKMRADRLRIRSKHLFLLFETNVQRIIPQVDATGAQAIVIDSIQTMYSEMSDALPGSPTQLRKCVYLLRRLAQEKNVVLIIVGQVTKEKTAAGPRTIEHAVDVVLMLEADAGHRHRRTLCAAKNRFGSTTPGCSLSMRKSGLVFDADRS